LLPRRVRHARQNPRLRDRGVALIFEHSADRDPFVTKIFQQHPSGLVVAHNADGKNIDAQVREVIRGVGRASRHHGSLTVRQDQHRSLA
jgi:hypothetical protein